jgi:hypothetical protein
MVQAGDQEYWRAALITFGTVALASGLVESPGFWSSYLLDVVGPAWIYILIRELFAKTQPAMLARFVSPEGALAIVTVTCFLIEAAQYFRLYEAHFDPLDLVAYVSLAVSWYVADRWLTNRRAGGAGVAIERSRGKVR